MTNATLVSNTQHFTDGNFESEVLRSDQPVLVDFYADWCGPCRALGPTIEDVAEQVAGDAKVGKLNVDDNPQTAKSYGIGTIPTVLVFQDGEVVDRLVGVQPQERYVGALEERARSQTQSEDASSGEQVAEPPVVYHRSVEVDGLDIFYREAGPTDAPTVLLLHGFPTSSHMFRNLVPALADRYHVVAPDYPGFGNSSMPRVDEFDYTFDKLADIVERLTERLGLDKYSLYLMDYGAPVGFRLAVRHPERVETLIVQNGNAYDEGLRDFWKPLKAYWKDKTAENADELRKLLTIDATTWQYTHGVRDVERISPDNWNVDQRLLDRPGNQEIQLALFYDYGSNPGRYPKWQEYLRGHQPPTLIAWGKNDFIFPADGAHPYKQDLKNVEFHLLDTGHFALEEDGDVIAGLMRDFLARHTADSDHRSNDP